MPYARALGSEGSDHRTKSLFLQSYYFEVNAVSQPTTGNLFFNPQLNLVKALDVYGARHVQSLAHHGDKSRAFARGKHMRREAPPRLR
jgi:hypothetical protein